MFLNTSCSVSREALSALCEDCIFILFPFCYASLHHRQPHAQVHVIAVSALVWAGAHVHLFISTWVSTLFGFWCCSLFLSSWLAFLFQAVFSSMKIQERMSSLILKVKGEGRIFRIDLLFFLGIFFLFHFIFLFNYLLIGSLDSKCIFFPSVYFFFIF